MNDISSDGQYGSALFLFKHYIPYLKTIENGTDKFETPANKLAKCSLLATKDSLGGLDSKTFWKGQSTMYNGRNKIFGNGKCLLIYDGFCAHLSLQAVNRFAENDIIVYALPIYTSGTNQPLDLVLFFQFSKVH